MKRLNRTIQTPSFWDLTQEFRTNKAFRLAESGRSMVEMLGVLAIIGVLSVGAVVGYKYATSKHVANTIMSELNLRAVPLSQIRIQNQMAAGTTLHLEAGDKIASGHTISAKVSINPEYFEMTVNGVQQQSCEMILEDYITSSWIMVNNSLYENTTSICNAEENDMTFVYSNNLGERRTCSQKGLFNVASYKCECTGGTYFDNGKKDCACPAGHVWSETERKCIESRCQEGEFESATDGCVPCDDPEGYRVERDDAIAVSLCKACPNRWYNSASEFCRFNGCVKGESVPNGGGNGCISCASSDDIFNVGESDISREYCNSCPNRFYSSYNCLSDNICPSGEIFNYAKTNNKWCLPCDYDKPIKLGLKGYVSQELKDICESTACGRTAIDEGSYTLCIKTSCSSNEFKGADGRCYSCATEEKAISVSDSEMCTSATCGRVYADGVCKQATCGIGYTLLSDGSCYKCDTTVSFKSTEEECVACGLKEDGEPVRGYLSNGYCRLNNCVLGESFPYASGGDSPTLCYKCAGNDDGAGATGNSAYAMKYCHACNNYLASEWCISKNSCNRGSEFRGGSGYLFCTDCSYTNKVKMAVHELHDEMCAACVTTPRFFDDDHYCYRCDSNETPIVTTSEARASCTACPNRQINADNQCVLVLTEE